MTDDNVFDAFGQTWTDELKLIEQEAIDRALKASESRQLPEARHVSTAQELWDLGFPYFLVPYTFSKNELDSLAFDMARSPTRAPLFLAYEEATEKTEFESCTALVFPWRGQGGLHSLVRDVCLTLTPQTGARGMYWCINDAHYLLEPLVVMARRVGNLRDW